MKINIKNLALFLLSTLPFIFVFISTLYTPLDPDLGWHLKYGEYFFQTGKILRDNTFSTEMPDYKWPNVSWGTDLITFLTFNNFGFFGLTILSSLIITLTFFFFSKLAKLSLFEQTLIFPLLIFFEKSVNQISFRGQLISILFLGILFYLTDKFADKKSKKIFLIVPLFFVWVNLHGQFLIGLILFLGWIMVKILVNFFDRREEFKTSVRKNIFQSIASERLLLLVFLLSFLVTFLNPFGVGLYQDALSHFNNRDLKSIAEYVPFAELSTPWWNQIVLGILIVFGFMFLHFNDSLKKNIPLFGVILAMYAMSFLVRRYAWSLYFLTMPFLKPVAEFFKPETIKYQRIASLVLLLILIPVTVSFKLPFDQYINMSWDKYCDEYGCSRKSAEFLQNRKIEGKLLTYYNWGGYLIWNFPKIKPSIDGRMHLWQDETGYSAFSQYYSYEQNFADIDQSKYDAVYMGSEKPLFDRMLELVRFKKWKMIYRDDNAGLFIRKKT